MLINFFLFFLPAMLIMVVLHYLFNCKYTVGELLVQLMATSIVIGLVIWIDNNHQLTDTMHINGVVSDKEIEERTCRRYWSTSEDSWCEAHYSRDEIKTRIVYDDKGNSSIETYIETYYLPKYSWERKYFVRTTVGDYTIDRIDEQGAHTPPFFKEVSEGDPATSTKRYKNYVKAASDTLFRHNDDSYPDVDIVKPEIYDYFKIDRLVATHDTYSEFMEINNQQLSNVNSKLTNGANIIVYLTEYPLDFAKSLQVKWEGFRLNDVVIVLGVDKDDAMYNYVEVFSWSESSMIEFLIRDYMSMKTSSSLFYDLEHIGGLVETHYVAVDPDKFSYLQYDVNISWFSYIFLIFVTMIVTPIVTYMFCRFELFERG